MAFSQVAEGDQACTVGTEHTLTTQTTVGAYALGLDLNPLAAGATPDVLEVRINVKANTGEASRRKLYRLFVGGQVVNPEWMSPVYPVGTEIVCTLKQIQGTGRTIPWALFRAT